MITSKRTRTITRMSSPISNVRPAPDQLLTDLADYALNAKITSDEAYDTARWCLDRHPGLRHHGPCLPGLHQAPRSRRPRHQHASMARGFPARSHELDPVQAAFNIGTMIRWLDFNDTWLAAEWGHPSDNLGGDPRHRRLALAHQAAASPSGKKPLPPRAPATEGRAHRHDQGPRDPGRARAGELLQPRRPRPRHAGQAWPRPPSPRTCSAAPATRWSTPSRTPGSTAQSLRTYRHAPNTGSRKSLGRRRRHQPRRAPGADRQDRRDGLSLRAHRQDLGLPGRAVQGQCLEVPAPVRQLRDGERAVQDLLPRRVPLADRGGMRDGIHKELKVKDRRRRDQARSPSAPTRPASASSTRPAR
jgi:hypothetical protein